MTRKFAKCAGTKKQRKRCCEGTPLTLIKQGANMRWVFSGHQQCQARRVAARRKKNNRCDASNGESKRK